MFRITKLREPRSLVHYRAQAGSSYDDADSTVKNDIRTSLLSEQGFLCAYCMERISLETMKIEHWACQSAPQSSALQLTYSNLLGCCKGNEGQRFKFQTCDTRKGNSPLLYSPSNSNDRIESKVNFRPNGEIYSSNINFDQELNVVLNLNLPRMVTNRSSVIEAIRKVLHKKKRTMTRQQLINLIGHVSARDSDNKLKPFFEVKVKYLKKKLASF